MSRPSTARSASSTGGPAASSQRSPRSASSVDKRYGAALAAPGELPVRRIVAGRGRRCRRARPRDDPPPRGDDRAPARRPERRAGSPSGWATSPDRIDGGAATVVELLARGVVEGHYEPKGIYLDKVENAPPVLDELVVVVPGGDAAGLATAAERGRIIGEGANTARTLANRASNDVSPEVLADEASAIAKRNGLSIDVISPDKAAELGMGMFLAVGRGSDNPPRMIVLRSGEAGQKDALGRHLAIVGKGVCFDSGGISIKPADRMEEMKMDKTGAATVIAAIETVARLAPGTPLLAIAPAVENMPGPHSTRPGDVVRALNGKMVDITNTDAEGRLILGDALTYAERLGATHLVDVATLTGAVGASARAPGHGRIRRRPSRGTTRSSRRGGGPGERYWQIPLVDDYVPDMDSWYGDLQNAGTAEGSLVKSGLFIREFVTRPWVHLDIGGTGYFRKPLPFAARGANGVTHATLVELALAGAG